MTRLRVGVDVRPALWHATGIARVARETFRALRRREDVEAHGFARAWRRPRADLAPLGAGVVRGRIPARVQRVLGLAADDALGGVDVFHHLDLVYAPVRAAQQVVTIHDLVFLDDNDWHPPGFRRDVEQRVRAAAARAAALVVPSERVAADVVRHGMARARDVHVVAHGVDHIDATPQPDDGALVEAALQRARLRRPEVLVVALGTREPRKNHEAILDATEARPDGRAALLLVGPRGWGVPQLEERLAAAATRSDARVATTGEVDEPTLAALLRTADVVAYPSFAEGFGLPVFEALRCGRAVVTSTNTPMSDLAGDAVITVDPHDPRALAAALEDLITSAATRDELGAAARQAVAHLTWDRAASALVDIDRALVEHCPGAHARPTPNT